MRVSLLALCLALLAAAPANAQQAAEWVRGSAKGIDYANMQSGVADLFGFFCRKVDNKFVGGMVMKMPVFHTLIRDEESYSLNIVIDGARDSVTLKAKDIELWYEANDLSQQLTLARLYDAVKASNRLQMGIAAIGWRGSYDYTNAAEKLDGLMDKCL
ncbi:hypothetical protein [Dongia rigui]|uniref:Uncharacterized protein n=1 Tax=Dongia rigui TaxID=940149 RepID=A0ABU5E364_9PROT|nr:hypothetical protein [Dongia rigui]MDY0874050.1 hypothetical protein [Dongia rigui]